MDESCALIPLALKRHDRAENDLNRTKYLPSNMQVFDSLLSDHSELIIYTEHSGVTSSGDIDQDVYHLYFKSKNRELKRSPSERMIRKAIHLMDVAFNFLCSYRGFQQRNVARNFSKRAWKLLKLFMRSQRSSNQLRAWKCKKKHKGSAYLRKKV